MYSVTTNERNGRRLHLHSGRRCALTATVLALAATQAPAQCMEEQKLTASDARWDARFGRSVSVSGDTAVAGAYFGRCAAGYRCGSAYVFRFDGTSWVEVQKLTASDAAEDDLFGTSVSVSGNTVVVGAPGGYFTTADVSGSAYVYRFDGSSWVEEAKLTASDAGAGARFGFSVSVSGDTAVVGASWDDCEAGGRCGSAYAFRFNGTSWLQEQKLTAADPAANDWFGHSVSVNGETTLVGAMYEGGAAADNSGSVHVFRFDGTSWVEEQKLAASDGLPGGEFGVSVSVSGFTVVVAARMSLCTANRLCGAAYVFRFNGTSWVEEQKLTASDGTFRDFFGSSVAVSGETVVVGASYADCAAAPDCGAVYVFRFNGTSWVEVHKLTASDAGGDDLFGLSVSVSGETTVVGAAYNCPSGVRCGSAYVFSCAFPTVVNLDIKPGDCPNPVNPKSRGVVPVAIVGSLDFDVAMVDPDSLILTRADGAGTGVSPLVGRRGPGNVGRRGPGFVIEDVATPSDGELCECHEPGGDGIDDLTLKFSTPEMSSALELSALPRGTTIELVLRGSLLDGTTFEAVDCIVIPGTPRHPPGLRSTGKPN